MQSVGKGSIWPLFIKNIKFAVQTSGSHGGLGLVVSREFEEL